MAETLFYRDHSPGVESTTDLELSPPACRPADAIHASGANPCGHPDVAERTAFSAIRPSLRYNLGATPTIQVPPMTDVTRFLSVIEQGDGRAAGRTIDAAVGGY